MLHLLWSVYDSVVHTTDIHLLLVGRSGTGKSHLAEQTKLLFRDPSSAKPMTADHVDHKMKQLRPTVGLNVIRVPALRPDGSVVLWDVGGHASLRNIWRSYFASCAAIVFVVDSTASKDEFEEDALLLAAMMRALSLRRTPFLIVSNKIDVEGHMSLREVQDRLRLVDIAASTADLAPPQNIASDSVSGFGGRVLRLMEVSALRGDGVKEAMTWIAEQAVRFSQLGTLADTSD